MKIDDEFLKIMACPVCVTAPQAAPQGQTKGELELIEENGASVGLLCRQCQRQYKIDENGIPNMLAEEAIIKS